MQTILITLAYDGGQYHGWQRQTHSKSVQEVVERALSKVYRQNIHVEASGRTDAGVHAYGQTATFEVESTFPIENLKLVVNRILPLDIFITQAMQVPEGFHARYHAVGKTYEYHMIMSETRDPFKQRFAHQVTKALNIDMIREAIPHFLGTHDFRTFMASGSQIQDTVRTVYAFELAVEGDELKFKITGDGFLYNMVRIIIGTLIHVGQGKINPSDITDIINSGDRNKAKYTAPACGLYLSRVYYDVDELKHQK